MTAVAPTSTSPALEEVTASYIAAASSSASAKGRRLAAQRFGRLFGDLDGWNHASVEQRRQVRTEVMSFAAHAAIASSLPVTPDFVSQSCCHWGIYIADAYPEQRDRFTTQALELGFTTAQSRRMWSHLARICVIAGTSPDVLTTRTYQQARTSYFDAVMASRASAPPRWLSTPLFGLDAVMFHRGQAPQPAVRRPWAARSAAEVGWEQITTHVPVMAACIAPGFLEAPGCCEFG